MAFGNLDLLPPPRRGGSSVTMGYQLVDTVDCPHSTGVDPRPWLGQGILFLRLLDLDPRELHSLPHGLDRYVQSH